MSTAKLREQYQIGEVLGVGTVGTIYRAVDLSSGQTVAIKKLHPTVSADRLIRARFRREMLILDRLHHPNIIRYYGGGEDEDGLLYYVMELVDGGTVKELVQTNGPLPWPAVVEIGRQLCSALQFAHNHGVIHRDIKPSNLFLSTTGVIKLGDFGIARDLDASDITSSGMTVGTHAYMAPEQITGDANITGKADLYSLGCCLFELLAGQTPFVADNFAQLFDQHLRSNPPNVKEFAPDCPDELEEIIQTMLAKQPGDRPFNARQVQAVMLRLDDSNDPDRDLDGHGSPADVGSEHVMNQGHEILLSRIQQLRSGAAAQNISWIGLGLVLGLIIAVITAAGLWIQ